MKTSLFSLVLLFSFAFTSTDVLTGIWESKSPTGTITRVVFKPDQSFEGFINKKLFVVGKYSLQDSLFTFQDNGCNGAWGTYKINFFSNSDSMRLVLIKDSCTERANGMQRLCLGRLK